MKNQLAADRRAAADVSGWIYAIVGVMVLLIVVSALLPSLTDSLTSFEENDTSGLAPVLTTILPILIVVGILLGAVTVFLAKSKDR